MISKPWYIKKITGFNFNSLPNLRTVAYFKFGNKLAKRKVVDSIVLFLSGKLPHKDVTIVNPSTKGLLPRPIAASSKEVAERLGLQILPSKFITKLGTQVDTHYAGLANGQMRVERRKNSIKIMEEAVKTSAALIIDDTYASGATLNEYKRAILQSSALVKDVWGLAYARYKTRDFLIEDINNHFLLWDLPTAVSLFNEVGYLTNTAFRILLGLSSFIFARFISGLSAEILKAMKENWEYFLTHNFYPHRKRLLREKFDILEGKYSIPEKISIKQPEQSRGLGDIMVFNSANEFDRLSLITREHLFENSDFVVVEEKNGYRPIRYMSNSRRWVPELAIYEDLSVLIERTLLGVLQNA